MEISPSKSQTVGKPARETGQALSIFSSPVVKSLTELHTLVADIAFSHGGSSDSVHPDSWKPTDTSGDGVNERNGVHSPEVTVRESEEFKLKRKLRQPKKISFAKPLQAAPTREDYKKDNGLHRDILDKGLRKGGTPSGYTKTFPSGMSGNPSENRQGVADGIAPGDVYGGLDNLLYESPYGDTPLYQDDVTEVGPIENNFTQRETDSNFSNKTRPRPSRKQDKDITPDSKIPTGEREPQNYDTYTGLGNVMYPLSGELDIEAQKVGIFVAYPVSAKKDGGFYYVGQEHSGEVLVRIKSGRGGRLSRTIAEVTLEYYPNVKSFNLSKTIPPDYGAISTAAWAKLFPKIVSNVPPVFIPLAAPKAVPTPKKGTPSLPTPGKKGYNPLKDPLLDQAAPGITEIEKLFTPITRWEAVKAPSGYTGSFMADPNRVDAETMELIDKTPEGKGKYFGWQYLSEERLDLLKEKEVERLGKHFGGNPVVFVLKTAAWDKAKQDLEQLRANPPQPQQAPQVTPQPQTTTP